jgi:hypothetical protein
MGRSEGEARSGSAPATAWLVTTPLSVVYGNLGAPELHVHEMQLFPGLVAVILAIIGAVCHPERREGPGRAAREGHASRATRAPAPSLTLGMTVLAVFTWLGIITDRTEWTIAGHRILSFTSADVPATLLVLLLVIRFARTHPRSEYPERWAAAAWILIGVVGSFGMNAFFHAFLYRRIGIFAAIRAPVRWAVIAYIGIAVWAAFGALALMKKRPRVVAPILIALAALDLRPSIRWEQAVPTIPPVYRWLKQQRVAPLIELPMANGMEYQFLLGATHHHLAQFNGVTPWSAPVHSQLRGKNDRHEFDDEFLSILEQHGARLVVVHVHALGDASPSVRAWLTKELAGGRLSYVRSFDHEIGGDFVFAVTRNYRTPLAEPEVPDGAGHLPAQKLARMLAGEPTHSDAIMATLDTPKPGETIRGPMRVRGWGLSPFTIRRVTLLLDAGRTRIDVPLIDARPDVKSRFSWYYFTPRPGFDVILPERPRGAGLHTDLQLEIEDEGRRVMRTTDIFIDWERIE